MLRLNTGTAEAAVTAPEKFTAAEGELVQSLSGKIELSLAPYEVARVDLV